MAQKQVSEREQGYKCMICELHQGNLLDMETHLVAKHRDRHEVPYWCIVCKGGFLNLAMAQKHFHNRHRGQEEKKVIERTENTFIVRPDELEQVRTTATEDQLELFAEESVSSTSDVPTPKSDDSLLGAIKCLNSHLECMSSTMTNQQTALDLAASSIKSVADGLQIFNTTFQRYVDMQQADNERRKAASRSPDRRGRGARRNERSPDRGLAVQMKRIRRN